MEIKQYTKSKRLNNVINKDKYINGKSKKVWFGIKTNLY